MNIRSLEIFFYQIDTDVYLTKQDELCTLLSVQELQKVEKYSTKQLRSRFCISHAILRKILAKHTSTTPENIRYNYNKFNKPYLQQPKTSYFRHQNYWHFSISHSHNTTCYALALNIALGIDIEYCSPQTDLNELMHAATTQREQTLLATLIDNHKLDVFYDLWTRKEAILKALGTGLSYPLNQLEVYNIPIMQKITIAPYDNILPSPVIMYCKTITASKKIKIAIASPTQEMKIISCDLDK